MKHFCIMLLFFTVTLQAQFQINGIVKDSTTSKPLPFATIITNDGMNTVSDVDGKFSFSTSIKTDNFDVSYIGFTKTIIQIEKDKKYYVVMLSQKTNNLNEIFISKVNPALAIIQKTIASKDSNNPQKKLNSFEFKTYNKLVVTANPDSINSRIDSVFVGKSLSKIDSSNYKFKEIVRQQHLFQTEKVSQFQFKNSKLKETILATKMAGFKQPVYEIISFNLQSFSIYDSSYELFETKYNSPIANDALKDYNYKLLDSTIIDGRNTYMVYFKNKKKSKASGLEGVLYIDQKNLAIAKAVMRIKGVLDISGIHEFKYISEEQLWFPSEKTFTLE